ncbi:hypothetical protein PSQ90_06610 [Devosia rhodophyticola]|uniref:Cytochrome P450 n=1 Tax=Devosia rhodophyticola TaxID=3026423 RepID=A0ABY7Z0D4_9HYPH|nr:hypothetical protein [Devosia rhodophyticola]WDR07100.1 hypothetical protein PSQ90_06610 [Devosia rhodophyticola]
MRTIRSLLNRFGITRQNTPEERTLLERYEPDHPQFVADPYPTYRWLRENEPVHRAPNGAFVLTRYDDVVAALANPALGNAPARYAVVHSRNRDNYVCADMANNILPFLDDPAHAGPRRAVARSFTGHLKSMPPDYQGFAQHCLERLQGRSDVELIKDFATPFVLKTICSILGFPDTDGDQLKAHSEYFFICSQKFPLKPRAWKWTTNWRPSDIMF